MAKLDSDVRNLINYLYFHVSATWDDMMSFLWSPDTAPDADLWVEPGPGANEVRLKDEIREFVIQADQQMDALPGHEFVFGYPIREKPREREEVRLCFLAMPTKEWLPTVQSTIQSAAQGYACTLSVDNAAPGDIMNRVWQDIRRSDVVLADLTGMNPNVFYELGLAHALGKTTILIKQEDQISVPFDVRHHKYFEYGTARLGDLETWLVDAFEGVPQRYRYD